MLLHIRHFLFVGDAEMYESRETLFGLMPGSLQCTVALVLVCTHY